MKEFSHEQGAKELKNLKEVQISLNGWELYSLIVVAQQIKKASCADNLGKTVDIAQMAARKLHRKLVSCPHVYTLLDQGWDLTESDLTSEKNDSNT